MKSYADFLGGKERKAPRSNIKLGECHESLYDFQRAITQWAIRRGRAAIFADCGLGKTRMQVEWARQMGGTGLIVCPLAVAGQTIAEAKEIGVDVGFVAVPDDINQGAISITNYEKVHKFVGVDLDSIVLDESSILKSVDGKTRTLLLREFTDISYRLCCTATPAPNDVAELANHCEFLGIMSRAEMLATFFVHDQDGWRLRGHGVDKFYEWMVLWAMFLRKPSDLGFDDNGFILPPLNIHEERVATDYCPEGFLFPMKLKGITERALVRKATLNDRVAAASNVILATWQKGEKGTGRNTTEIIVSSGSESPRNTKERTQKSAKSTCVSGTPKTRKRSERNKQHTETQTGLNSARGEGTRTALTQRSTRRPPASGHGKTEGSGETPPLSSPTELASKTSTGCSTGKAEGAQSAGGRLHGLAEMGSMLITATTPESLEASCVQVAILGLESSATTPRSCEPQLNTSKEQWVVWCGLNDEQRSIAKALGEDCVSIEGSMPPELKIEMVRRWLRGDVPVLVSKVAIFGFGMNFQNCSHVMFLGLGDSYEQYYQAIRRCWRFGQQSPVDVVIVISEAEVSIVENVRRKERHAAQVADGIIANVRDLESIEVRGAEREKEAYVTGKASGNGWDLWLGDSCELLADVKSQSVGLSVFSPPFASLFTYTASDRDLGNSKSYAEFFEHFDFIIAELLRVMMSCRRACVHVQQITTTKATHGVIGWRDFRADTVRAFQGAGFIYDGEIVIDKDPQAQAIRTKSKALMFVQKNKDSAWSRPAMADYILLFRAPGENREPIKTDVTNEEWIHWARPIWYGIRESNTLNVREARSDKDDRHICPLQLETIERIIRLWSNPGDLILSTFAGIGSEGYEAVRLGRRFLGIELKPEYFKVAARNLVEAARVNAGLFAGMDSEGVECRDERIG